MIGVRVWARWPWPLVRLVCNVRKRRAFRHSQPEVHNPWIEWHDHGGEA
jgi:hypothetical protein